MRRTTLAHATAALAFLASGGAYGAPNHADSVGAGGPGDSAPEASPPDVPASDQQEPTEPAQAPAPTGAASDASAPTQTPPAPTPKRPVEDTDVLPPIVPLARDTVGGHFAVGVTAALLVPFGSIQSGAAQSSVFGPGFLIGGDIGYGVSRAVMIGAYGEFGIPSARGADTGTHVSTIAAGPFVRYHLVQGLSFDPWVTAGVGFRRTTVGSESLTGIDWVRLAFGGDWYPASAIGLGPVVEMSLGTFFDSSAGSLGTKAVNAQFVVGGRVVFDGPGK